MYNYLKSLVFVIIILFMNVFCLFAQEKEKGKLAEFEEQVKDKSDSDDDDTDDSFGIFVGGSPGDIYNVLIITEDEINDGTWYCEYSDFPYSENSIGIFSPNSQKTVSVISEINYFHHSNKLSGFDFNSRLSPYPLFSFELKYSDLTEKLRIRYDHLKMFGIFINYNRLKHEHIAFWWGLGVKGILGDRTYYGFAVNTGAEIFPIEPVSLSTNFNLGFLNSTEVYDFSIKLKYHLERTQFSLGYQKYAASTFSINGITLGIGFYL